MSGFRVEDLLKTSVAGAYLVAKIAARPLSTEFLARLRKRKLQQRPPSQ
jgi:predicted LPLAT superfamily acyltransferase